MFFPLQGERRLRATVKRVDGERVRVIREDGSEVTVPVDRLLESDGDGNGRYYRFHGWKPRPRGYRTELRVIRVSAETRRCLLMLPEWDPGTEIEEALAILPEKLWVPDAVGSCMANLASPTASGLAIHSCKASKLRVGSRVATVAHPDVVAEGQRYRRRNGGVELRVLDVVSPRVRAWNGRRVVWLSEVRMLSVRPDGTGCHYEYLGGGVWETRRKRHRQRS